MESNSEQPKKHQFPESRGGSFARDRRAIKEITITIKNTIPKIIIIINKVQEFINTINMFHI